MDTPPPPPTLTPAPVASAIPAPTGSRVSPRLIGLNIALLAVLGLVTFLSSGPARAQPDEAAARSRGDYTAVSGRLTGGNTAVYILDAANQEMVALFWNRNNNQLEPIGFRSLIDDKKFLNRPR